ncbi:hypothetical protein Tco_0625408 [Tanacetum coccineum]|uniref:Uncharacterized protein n=1 Tax=Tanacetum coccineum TaxID=301880 RepID=A0ABQ4WGR2_9ASTR
MSTRWGPLCRPENGRELLAVQHIADHFDRANLTQEGVIPKNNVYVLEELILSVGIDNALHNEVSRVVE